MPGKYFTPGAPIVDTPYPTGWRSEKNNQTDLPSFITDDINESKYDKGLLPNQDPMMYRGENQPILDKWANGVVSGAGTVAGTMIGGVGFLLGAPENVYNLVKGENLNFSNWMSEAGNKLMETTKESFPVYMSQTAKSGNFFERLTSASYWSGNIGNIASTLSYLIPTTAGVKLLSMAGKLARLEKITGTLGLTTKLALQGVSGAVISRQMESMAEGKQTFDMEYEKAIQMGKSEQVAKDIAGKAASFVYKANWLNLMQDIPEYMILFGRGKDFFGKPEGFLKQFTKVAALEGIEEGTQYVMQKEGEKIGDDLLGLKDTRDFGTRLWDYMDDPEFTDSVFLGALGGGGAMTYQAIKNRNIDKTNKNLKAKVDAQIVGTKNKQEGNKILKDSTFNNLAVDASLSGNFDAVEEMLTDMQSNHKAWGFEDVTANHHTSDPVDTKQLIAQRIQDLKGFKDKWNELHNEIGTQDVRFGPLMQAHINRTIVQRSLTDVSLKLQRLQAENQVLAMSQHKDASIIAMKDMQLKLQGLHEKYNELAGETQKYSDLMDQVAGRKPASKKDKKKNERLVLQYGETFESLSQKAKAVYDTIFELHNSLEKAKADHKAIDSSATDESIHAKMQNLYANESTIKYLEGEKEYLATTLTDINKRESHERSQEGKKELEAKKEKALKEASEKANAKLKEEKEKADREANEKLKKEKLPLKQETTAEPTGEEGSGQVVENENVSHDKTYGFEAGIKAERDSLDPNDPEFATKSELLDRKEYKLKRDAVLAEIRAEYKTNMEKASDEQSSQNPINPNDFPAQVAFIRTIFAKMQLLEVLPKEFKTLEERTEGFKDAMKFFQELIGDTQLKHDFNLIRFTFDQLYGGTTKLDYNDVFMTDDQNKAIEASQGLKLTSEDGDYQPLSIAEKRAAEKAIKESLKPVAPNTLQEIDPQGNIVALGPKSINAAHQLAYGTSTEYEDQTWSDGRTQFSDVVQTSNELVELQEPMIIVPGYYEQGEELTVQVHKGYSISNEAGRVIESYESLSQDERERYAKGESDALYGLIPFIVTNKEGKIVSYLHDIDFMRPERVVAKINGEDNIIAQRKKIIAIRKYIFEHGPQKIVITGKGYGKINFNLGTKGEINDAGNRTSEMFKDPELPIGLARNDKVMLTKEKPASSKYQMLNTQVRNGAPYALLRMPNNVYFPAFLNPDKVGKKYATSMMKVLGAYMYKNSENQDLKELSAILQKEIFDRTSINIHTREGVKAYFNLFIYTAHIDPQVLNQSARGQSELKRYFDISPKEGASIVRFAEQGERMFAIDTENEFRDEQILRQLQYHLENMFISFKFKHMDALEDFNFPVVNEDNTIEDNQMSYTQFVKNHTTVNIVGNEVKDAQGKTHYVYTNNPVITFSTPFLEESKPKEGKKEKEVKKEEVKPSKVDEIKNSIKSSLPVEISNTVEVVEDVPKDILGRDDLFLSLKEILNDNGITDEVLINWAGANQNKAGDIRRFKTTGQLLDTIEKLYDKLKSVDNHPALKTNKLAKESFDKWVKALANYPAPFREMMLTHAVKYLNPSRRAKFVLQLSEVALTQAYGIVVNKPHELNRIGKLYDQEVLKTISDAVGHEPAASGKGYWVHIPRTEKLNTFNFNSYEEFKKYTENRIKDLKEKGKEVIIQTFTSIEAAAREGAGGIGRPFYDLKIVKNDRGSYELRGIRIGEIATYEKQLENIKPENWNNSAQFKVNVELLRKLSPSTWCTASGMAGYYVENYDNYILIVNGITVAGIEAYPEGNYKYENEDTGKRQVKEVTSRGNNGTSSIDHYDDILAFFEKHNLDTDNDSLKRAKNAKDLGKKDAQISEDYFDPQDEEERVWYPEDDWENQGADIDQERYAEQARQEDEYITSLGNIETVEAALQKLKDDPQSNQYVPAFRKEISDNEEFATLVVENDAHNIVYIDHTLPFYMKLVYKAIEKEPYVYTYLSEEAKQLQGIKDIYDAYTEKRRVDAENERIRIAGLTPEQLAAERADMGDDLPFSKTASNQIQGYYDAKNDKVVVIAANTPVNEAAKVAIHEVAHRGMLRMAKELGGVKELNDALNSAEKQLMEKLPELLKRTGHKNLESLLLDYGFDANTEEGKFKLLQELAARWAETLVNKPKPSWWKELLQKIGDWIKKFTGKVLNEEEVNELVGGFVKYGTMPTTPEAKSEKKARKARKGPQIGGEEGSSQRPDMEIIISQNLWNANKNRIFAKDMNMTEEYWNNLSLEEQKNIIDCL